MLAYFYCTAYTKMKVNESSTNCDQRSVIDVMSLGRLFQDAEPEYEKARSPILRRRAGSSYLVLAEDLSRLRFGRCAVAVIISVM